MEFKFEYPPTLTDLFRQQQRCYDFLFNSNHPWIERLEKPNKPPEGLGGE